MPEPCGMKRTFLTSWRLRRQAPLCLEAFTLKDQDTESQPLHRAVHTGPHASDCSSECRFVLENSGVAEPQNIRDKFADAVATGAPCRCCISHTT